MRPTCSLISKIRYFIVLLILWVPPLMAQSKILKLHITNREAFVHQYELNHLLVPDQIEVPLESLKSLYPPSTDDLNLDSYQFEITDYHARKGLLTLTGQSPEGEGAEYIFNIEEQWGVLKIGDDKFKFKDAFGVWKCTNHSPHHACGPEPYTLKKCTDDHACVF